jgi:hypothetical protein
VLIAFDPGKMTGAALCGFDPETKFVHSFGGFQLDPTAVLDWLWRLTLQVPTGQRICVGYESFKITEQTAKKTRQYDALYFIGALRWIAHHCTMELDAPRDPAAAKKITNNDKLHRLGFWTTSSEHANDAARHLVLMLLDRGWYSTVFE